MSFRSPQGETLRHCCINASGRSSAAAPFTSGGDLEDLEQLVPETDLVFDIRLTREAMCSAVLVLFLSRFAVVQDTKPNFTGTWRAIRTSLGPVTGVLIQIEQSESAFSFRSIIPDKLLIWIVYPTDGKVITRKRTGRISDETTGHWESGKLILDETGAGNIPGAGVQVAKSSPCPRTANHDYRVSHP
jgi:hypothetical protein